MKPIAQRDKVVIVLALVGVAALAWAYVVYLWAQIPTMVSHDAGPIMQIHPWGMTDFVLMILMWAIMMVGMMLPSATPMTLLYAGIARKAMRQGTLIAPSATFVSGYLTMWCLFSVGATFAQWGLHHASLLSPMMAANSKSLGACLLILAGLYQLTPWKKVCLDHCRWPANFISQHWKKGVSGAFRMGLEYGAFCVGCCWALMGLLFFAGVMNLLWIAAIAIFVLLEKFLPFGVWGGRTAGSGMILAGMLALAS